MSRPRVGVVFTGDARDPRARSGTPFGVVTGMESLGIEVVTVRAAPPSRVDRAVALALAPRHLRRTSGASGRERMAQAYMAAHVSPQVARVRTEALARSARGVHVDGWVQLGAGYAFPVLGSRVVYDDMTVPQATRYPYRNWSALSPVDVARRVALQRAGYLSATTCCMTSSWAARSAVEDLGVPPGRVAVVGAGTHEQSRHVDRDWSVPRFLFVGFDWQRKNGPRVLEAFKRVRVVHPQATLDLVGGHPEVSLPGVSGHGVLRRDVSEDRDKLKSLFDRSTCFVMPSLFEPAGVVFTEAAAAGLPSVAGTNGGSVDFVGEGGIMVDPQSSDQLFGAMLSLANAEAAQRVGALAADRSRLFTWSAVAARLLRGLGLTPPEGQAQDYLPFRAEDDHSPA